MTHYSVYLIYCYFYQLKNISNQLFAYFQIKKNKRISLLIAPGILNVLSNMIRNEQYHENQNVGIALIKFLVQLEQFIKGYLQDELRMKYIFNKMIQTLQMCNN
ncbi:unnamed protein product [Paramecium sonneborni]|uniref:Uncharacterized protein n=1 Tax=Paramecium sonneborni TaxID=65129 RepID=A0A8S1K7A1_9CILI|nr:unnamed protein product [Paramecium sonneborni]CAD8048956.1 unnamed protein product [Paramecium sonneborni]